jgi:Protein of unknown function (DUF1640)
MTEKNDLAMVKAENERLLADIEKLKQRLREEISRTQAGVRLDLNLEKGRMREESSGQELKITEVDTRIEQEIASLRTAIQASKVSNLPRTLVPFTTTVRYETYSWLDLGYDASIPRRIRYWMLCSINGISEIQGLTLSLVLMVGIQLRC